MRRRLIVPFLALLPALAAFAGDDWRPLFNGTLRGWRTWLGAPPAADGKPAAPLGWERDPFGTFTVVTEDGAPALRAAGPVLGLIATTESFRDYHLRLQFKWGAKTWPPRETLPRDSGLHFHVHGEPGQVGGAWAPCLEFQIQEHDCGDLWAIDTAATTTGRIGNDSTGYRSALFDPAAPRVALGRPDSPSNHAVKLADFEKPHGEWNTLELICLGERIVYVVNGRVVLRLDSPRRKGAGDFATPLTGGPIALQSEQAEVFFRRIELRSIAEIPAEFRPAAGPTPPPPALPKE